MPENDHYVIIGNGPAGNHAADVLRDNDKEARISIISDEPVTYYLIIGMICILAGIFLVRK